MKFKGSLIFLALLVSPVFALSTNPINLRSDISVILTYDLARPDVGENEDGYADPFESFRITETGTMKFLGEHVPPSQIEAIASTLERNESGRISVIIDGKARFSDVLFRTFEISRSHKFEFAGLGEHRKFAFKKSTDQLVDPLLKFQGTYEDSQLPMVIRHSGNGKNCAIALNGKMLGPEELYDRSFQRLDGIVEQNGGVESILENPDILNNIVVRAQVSEDTPWHCVAGAIYNVQAAGWPTVQFEMMRSLRSVDIRPRK